MTRPIATRAKRKLARAVSATTLGCLAFAAAAITAPATSHAELLIDIRATNVSGVPVANPDSVTIANAGDVVAMDVYARVSGTNALNDETFKLIHGVFRSSTDGLLGDLQSANVTPFIGSAAQSGSQIDIDGDGDLDIGAAPNGGQANMFFVAFSANDEPNGVALNATTEEFLIGTMTWTATTNHGETFIDFIRRRNPGSPGSNNPSFMSYSQDVVTDPLGSLRTGTSPYNTDGLRIVGVPEPTTSSLGSLASLRLLTRRRRDRLRS